MLEPKVDYNNENDYTHNQYSKNSVYKSKAEGVMAENSNKSQISKVLST